MKYMIHEKAWIEAGEVDGEWVAGLFIAEEEEAPATFVCRLPTNTGERWTMEGAAAWADTFRRVVAEARPDLDPRIAEELERQRELTDRLEQILSKAEGGT